MIKEIYSEHEKEFKTINEICNRLETDGELDIDNYESFEESLKDHIYIEEEYLFPLINEDGRVGLEIAGFEAEHGAVWNVMEMIHRDIENQNYAKIKKYLNEIRSILQEHQEREEKYLFSRFPDFLPNNLAKRPPEWRARRSRIIKKL